MKRLLLSVTVIITALLLFSCKAPAELSMLPNGDLSDAKSGIVYAAAPMNVEAEAVSKEAYAKCGDVEYYQIGELDTTVWLSEQIGGYVYCSDPDAVPTDIESFEANKLFVCVGESVVTGMSIVEDAEDVKLVIDAYINGESVDRNPNDNRYLLKFSSDKYPGLYFALDYYQSSAGVNYIFNRETGDCRDVGSVLDKYMPKG